MKFRAPSAFSVLLGSSVFAQAILIACSMLFARLYSPEAFGTLAQVTGLASIATIVAGLRFDHLAFSKPDEEKTRLYGAAFLVLLLLTAIVGAAALLLAWANRQAAAEYTWMALFVVANGTYYLCSQWQIAQGSYLSYGRVRMVQAGLQLGIGAALFASAPMRGMLLAAIVSQAVAAVLAMRNESVRPSRLWDRSTVDSIRTNLKAATTNSASALLQYATPFAPIVVGSLFFNKSEIGAYFLFSSAVAAPCAVLRRAILSYFNGEVKSAGQIRRVLATSGARLRVVLVLMLIVGVAMLAALNWYGGSVTDLVFGKSWHQYSPLLVPLVVFFTMDTLLQPFSTFLGMWGRERTQIVIELLRFVLTYVAWPLIVLLVGLKFVAAIVVYLALMLAVYVLNCAIVLRHGSEPRGFALS